MVNKWQPIEDKYSIITDIWVIILLEKILFRSSIVIMLSKNKQRVKSLMGEFLVPHIKDNLEFYLFMPRVDIQ